MGQSDLVALLGSSPHRRIRAQVAGIVPVGLSYNGLGGTSGSPVTGSDTGVGDQFDAVNLGTGAAITYDSSQGAPQGCQSMQVSTGATAATGTVKWTSSLGLQDGAWCSMYLFFTAPPPSTFSLITSRRDNDQGGAQARINASGQIQLHDGSGVLLSPTQSVIPFNSPFRLEYRVMASNGVGGIVEVRLFAKPNSSVPDEVLTIGGIATSPGGQNVFGFRYGVGFSNVANVGPFWMWGLRASNVGYPPPMFPIVGLSDSAVGSDTLVDSSVVNIADSGSGDDSQFTSSASIALADSGIGNDSQISVAASVGLSDSAVGSDLVNDSATVALPDAASSADSIVAAISAQLIDSGSGSDVIAVSLLKLLTDSGSGIDSIVVSAIANFTDFGEGVDAVVQYFHFSDQAIGIDSAVVAVTVSLVDSGQGTDTLQANNLVTVNLSDAGVGTDTIVVVPDNAFTKSLTDSGSGADSLIVSPLIRLSDTGIGSDAISVTVQMWLGFDDPVPEGHTAFDPEETAKASFKPKAAFTPPAPYAERTGMVVVPQIWGIPVKQFVAHMAHMHAGKSVELHALDHTGNNGEGGVVRHIHR